MVAQAVVQTEAPVLLGVFQVAVEAPMEVQVPTGGNSGSVEAGNGGSAEGSPGGVGGNSGDAIFSCGGPNGDCFSAGG